MAEESPKNIDPAVDPQVEDPPSTAVPLAEIDRAPGPVGPELAEVTIPDSAIVIDATAVPAADPQQPPADQPTFVSELIELTNNDPQAAQPIPQPSSGFNDTPAFIGGNYLATYDPKTGTYEVVDIDTGEVVETGLSQQTATIAAQDLSQGDPQVPTDTGALAAAAEGDIIREPTDVDVAESQFVETDAGFFELREEATPQPDQFEFVETDTGLFVRQDEIESQIDQQQFEDVAVAQELEPPLSEINTEPENISLDQQYQDEPEGTIVDLNTGQRVTAGEAQAEAARIEAQRQNLRNQQSIREQRGNNVDSADWRVRLRLAPQARYLYLDNEYGPGILEPLAVSDGIIFPYTPTIQTVYKADYTPYNLTHSNYRGFFYQSSYVEDIQITGTFTAQDSTEAAYLLAVIHFFRSATKMFYGQDPNRGAPPPLVYLSAFGAYQYVDAPCVIASFNYNLPADVDYIRARAPNIDGTNLLKRRQRQSLPTNAFSSALQRLKNARTGGLPLGGERPKPAPPTLGLSSPTYVPTKMDITITLHPMQSRKQVSQQFSVREYGPGRLTPKGFW